MNSPEISVVVPLYNVEELVRKCLESIKQQTFEDFEVWVVDDESTDNSAAVADEFAAADSRFHVIRNKHSGPGIGRNVGLENSTGKYIVFIDSDDFVTPDYLEKLHRACEDNDADVAICNFAFYYPEKNKIKDKKEKPEEGIICPTDAINLLLRDSKIQSYIWNKMYKRSMFIEHNIRYPEIYFEDISTMPQCLFYANRIVVIHDILYFYTQRNGSIVNKNRLDLQKTNDLMTAAAKVKTFLATNGNFDDFKKSFNYFVFKFRYAATWFVFINGDKNHKIGGLFKRILMVYKNFQYIKTHNDTNLPHIF